VEPERGLVLVSRWVDGPDVNELIGRILAAHDTSASDPVASDPPGGAELAVRFGPSFQKVFPDDAALPNEFGERAEIMVARNEVEAIQLVLESPVDLSGVSVRVGSLVGPGGAVIPQENVEVRTVGLVNLLEPKVAGGRVGWHPDPLLPNQRLDLEAGVRQSWLVSVRTHAETLAGDYQGRLVIETEGETITRELAVRVWDVLIPATPTFKSTNFASWDLPRRLWPINQGYPPLDNAGRLERMLTLADLGYAYRLPPAVYLANGLSSWNQGGQGGTNYGFPTHDPVDANSGTFNAERTGRLIDYMLERGANHFFIAVTGNVWRPEAGSEARRSRLITYLREYRDYLRSRGLLDMAYVYNIDEPWHEGVVEARQTYALIRGRVGDDLRIMQNTNQPNAEIVPRLMGFFDVLNVNLGFHDSTDVDRYRELHPTELGEVWWNVNLWPEDHPNLFLEYPLIDARIIGPMSYAHGISGFEYWDMVWVPGIGAYHPIASDELRVEWDVDSRSLDGTLVYPAQDFDVYPSLRLASLRDGFEDFELLHLLADVDPGNPLLRVPIVEGTARFTQDPGEYLDFRRRVAEAILAATS
jgi:hypothetical protein